MPGNLRSRLHRKGRARTRAPAPTAGLCPVVLHSLFGDQNAWIMVVFIWTKLSAIWTDSVH